MFGCANRGLMAHGKKSLEAGAKRTAQSGKLGETSRGNRFSDSADRRGLHRANRKGGVARAELTGRRREQMMTQRPKCDGQKLPTDSRLDGNESVTSESSFRLDSGTGSWQLPAYENLKRDQQWKKSPFSARWDRGHLVSDNGSLLGAMGKRLPARSFPWRVRYQSSAIA